MTAEEVRIVVGFTVLVILAMMDFLVEFGCRWQNLGKFLPLYNFIEFSIGCINVLCFTEGLFIFQFRMYIYVYLV